MKLDKNVQGVEVFYDGHCGMCSSFTEWLVKQERALELKCLPYQSEEAQRIFPEIVSLHPEKEMIVRVDGEGIYRGAEGWVWCLWSCEKYQDIAKIMNCRLMLPVARKVCLMASNNRLKLSKLFFGKKAAEVADEIHSIKDDGCEDGECDLDPKQ